MGVWCGEEKREREKKKESNLKVIRLNSCIMLLDLIVRYRYI